MRSSAPNGKVTMRDIARRFKVNTSTVSRALAGDTRISEAIRFDIKSYASEVRYKPSPLRRSRKQAIGLMSFCATGGEPDDSYQKEIVHGASKLLFAQGYHLHVEFLRREASSWPAFLTDCRVDGVLLAGHPPLEVCKRLRAEGVPAALISDTLERTGCFCARPDPTDGTVQAVRRLIELGHRQIGLVASRREYPTVEQRYQAFCFAMFDAGLTPNPALMAMDMPTDMRGGRQGVREILKAKERPSAIVFINDQMAVGGMMELLARGLRIPEDVSVLGHDNSGVCEELEPRLSSVDMAFDEVMAEAVELLRLQIEEGFDKPVERALKSRLVERESFAKAKA